MILALVIAVWLAPIVLLVWALCRAAALGDQQADRAQRGRAS